MNRAWARVLMAMFAIGTFCVTRSSACSCVDGPGLPGTCGDFKLRGPSFVGTVIDIQNPPKEEWRNPDQGGFSRYRFRVDENIGGFDQKEVDVYSGRGFTDCSYHFRKGVSYLVKPYTVPGDERLMTNICNGTGAAANAEALIELLRARRDANNGAEIDGVLRTEQQPHNSTFYAYYDRPLPGVSVELQGQSISYSTQTDESGTYRFEGIPAGTYRFAAKLPPHLELAPSTRSDPSPEITIAKGQPCYQEKINALPTARVRGRVIDPQGFPLKGADVELFRRERYKENLADWWTVRSDGEGYFEFDHLAPGLYLVVFNNSNTIDASRPYSRTFYPNTADFESAEPIAIGEDEQIGGPQEVLNADIHVRHSVKQDPTPQD